MAKWRHEDLLEVLSCDIDERPAAPGPEDLAPFIRSASITDDTLVDTLVLTLDDAGLDVAEAFVAAEQVCCSSIGWAIERTPSPMLRITASPEQIKVLARLVPSSIHIERHQ